MTDICLSFYLSVSVVESILSSRNVVLATCVGAASKLLARVDKGFDLVGKE